MAISSSLERAPFAGSSAPGTLSLAAIDFAGRETLRCAYAIEGSCPSWTVRDKLGCLRRISGFTDIHTDICKNSSKYPILGNKIHKRSGEWKKLQQKQKKNIYLKNDIRNGLSIHLTVPLRCIQAFFTCVKVSPRSIATPISKINNNDNNKRKQKKHEKNSV